MSFGHTIRNNFIFDVGRQVTYGAAVYIHQSRDNIVTHNVMAYSPRNLISVFGVVYLCVCAACVPRVCLFSLFYCAHSLASHCYCCSLSLLSSLLPLLDATTCCLYLLPLLVATTGTLVRAARVRMVTANTQTRRRWFTARISHSSTNMTSQPPPISASSKFMSTCTLAFWRAFCACCAKLFCRPLFLSVLTTTRQHDNTTTRRRPAVLQVQRCLACVS